MATDDARGIALDSGAYFFLVDDQVASRDVRGNNLQRQVARDISYAHSAETRSGQAVIRIMENATGRLRMIRRAAGYQEDITQGRNFWDVMVQRYGLSFDVTRGDVAQIPATGPLVVVANHPFGILDGLMMGYLLNCVRGGDFRILAHRVFQNAEDLDRIILPISFDETKEAVASNLQTRHEALAYLKGGGAVGVFPGGTVSTSARPFSAPMDPIWRNFTAKMISKSGATVIPLYYEGANSRLFQVASRIHPTLRMGLLIKEFRRRVDASVRIAIGEPILASEMASLQSNQKALMDFLRSRTYALSPNRADSFPYGFEFEEKHKRADTNGGRNIR